MFKDFMIRQYILARRFVNLTTQLPPGFLFIFLFLEYITFNNCYFYLKTIKDGYMRRNDTAYLAHNCLVKIFLAQYWPK